MYPRSSVRQLPGEKGRPQLWFLRVWTCSGGKKWWVIWFQWDVAQKNEQSKPVLGNNMDSTYIFSVFVPWHFRDERSIGRWIESDPSWISTRRRPRLPKLPKPCHGSWSCCHRAGHYYHDMIIMMKLWNLENEYTSDQLSSLRYCTRFWKTFSRQMQFNILQHNMSPCFVAKIKTWVLVLIGQGHQFLSHNVNPI